MVATSSLVQASAAESPSRENLQALITQVDDWCIRNEDLVANATLLQRKPGEYLLMAVPATGQYDETLEDRLTDLDLSIATAPAYGDLTFDVLSGPVCMHDDFVQRQNRGLKLPQLDDLV